jgi:hypothetical protein
MVQAFPKNGQRAVKVQGEWVEVAEAVDKGEGSFQLAQGLHLKGWMV